jgi:SAM-dependent methyltransferase
VYTIAPALTGDERRLQRVVQIVADLAPKPLHELRILDLACLEGQCCIEFARRGAAAVVGIEGRGQNLAKARFAKEALSLDQLELLQDDVRNLDRDRHGEFDVVLCLGILYHLDGPDVLPFLQRIASVCRGIAIVETHISLAAEEQRQHGGRVYWGRSFREHDSDSSRQTRLRSAWASIDNEFSFIPTRPSLINALGDVGFTTVCECLRPAVPEEDVDRVTLVAVRGTPARVASAPLLDGAPEERWPERRRIPPHINPAPHYQVMRRIVRAVLESRLLPPAAKRTAWRLLRRNVRTTPCGDE